MSDFIPVCEPLLIGNESKYVNDALASGWISSAGKYVSEFENAFAEYCDCRYGVAVCNGTVAIHLAITALGIGKGDEVIIPTFTMIATAFAVCYSGATPVFVDADPLTWNLDTTQLEKKITKRTKAIIPVHIFGNPCDMDEIGRIAKKHRLYIIEDAAEAHGALYKDRKTGSFSDIAAFSFYANKNITTGEGGMVVTNNRDYYDKCRYFKNLCFPLDAPRTYLHDHIGFNYRMSNLHAAIGLAQTEKADEYRKRRIRNAALYKQYLAGCVNVVFQQDEKETLNVHWMNAIAIKSVIPKTRDVLIEYLKGHGVDTRLLFEGMHRQKSLIDFGCDCSGDFHVSDWLSANGLYLPSGSGLSEEQIKRICATISSFFESRK